jgi:ribosomal protein L25 (general stress protein Ctc)
LVPDLEGTRKIGRPRLRWDGDVIRDIRSPGAKNCGNVAVNREDWLKLLKKAKAHARLSS